MLCGPAAKEFDGFFCDWFSKAKQGVWNRKPAT